MRWCAEVLSSQHPPTAMPCMTPCLAIAVWNAGTPPLRASSTSVAAELLRGLGEGMPVTLHGSEHYLLVIPISRYIHEKRVCLGECFARKILNIYMHIL